MSVDSDKSKRLKAILKVGEDTLVTHKGDSEDSLLKSSSTLGAVNSNQEFVIYSNIMYYSKTPQLGRSGKVERNREKVGRKERKWGEYYRDSRLRNESNPGRGILSWGYPLVETLKLLLVLFVRNLEWFCLCSCCHLSNSSSVCFCRFFTLVLWSYSSSCCCC